MVNKISQPFAGLIKEPKYSLYEKDTYRSWLCSGGRIFHSDGKELIVLDPGTRNLCGPDFKNALLILNGTILSGSVEIHRFSVDWYQHSHHLNQEYNSVVLQVVFQEKNPKPVFASDGKEIPSFYLDLSEIENSDERCLASYKKLQDEILRKQLLRNGYRRIEEHTGTYLRLLSSFSLQETFYRGLCDALGYGVNRPFFRLIPEILSLNELEKLFHEAEFDLQAVYNRFILKLQSAIRENLFSGSFAGTIPVLKKGGFRPQNNPYRRFATLLKAIKSVLKENLLGKLMQVISLRVSASGYLSILRKSFSAELMIAGENHPRKIIPGYPRLIEFSINVLLPLFLAHLRLNMNIPEEAVINLIYELPPGETIGKYQRFSRQLSASLKLKSALEWQGLIHLRKNYCNKNFCSVCPLILL